ncbi:hypothetical protein ACFWXK_14315 [Streptomyces sp. NPDC059070]|uniref:hypothetical protein n=1 Tax=Streptomyces sp. NPDC059070 TaxID=3346713 RepID=UPI0036CADC98
MPMRRFLLDRAVDTTGVSGVGVVAEGVEFSSGNVVMQWLGEHPSIVVWPDLRHALAVHGHDGATTVRWLDEV